MGDHNSRFIEYEPPICHAHICPRSSAPSLADMVGISCPCVAGPHPGVAKVFHQRPAQLSKKYSNDREDKDWPQFSQHSDVSSHYSKQ